MGGRGFQLLRDVSDARTTCASFGEIRQSPLSFCGFGSLCDLRGLQLGNYHVTLTRFGFRYLQITHSRLKRSFSCVMIFDSSSGVIEANVGF